jgi:ABC-type branched-subunit amino acid transport system substrate-binding protein
MQKSGLVDKIGRSVALAAFFSMGVASIAEAADRAPGISSDEIKIGGVFALSGPARLITEGYEQGIRVVFKKVNEEGGIHGRKINWIVYDDAYQPARQVAGVKRLVELDDVFLLFGNLGTPTAKAVMPYVDQAKVPYFIGTASPEPTNRYTFGLMADYAPTMYQVTKYMIQHAGVKKLGYLYQNDEMGAAGRVGVERALKELNVSMAADAGFERGTSDFATQVLKLRDAGADGIVSMSVGPSTATAVKQALGMGYKPKWSTFSVGGTAQMQSLLGPAVDGMTFASEIDTQYSDSVSTREAKSLLARYYPGATLDWGTMIGYAHGRLIVEILKAAGPNPTREGVISAAESKNFDLGVMAPVSFTPVKRTAANAVAVFQWKAGRVQRVSDWSSISESK